MCLVLIDFDWSNVDIELSLKAVMLGPVGICFCQGHVW